MCNHLQLDYKFIANCFLRLKTIISKFYVDKLLPLFENRILTRMLKFHIQVSLFLFLFFSLFSLFFLKYKTI